MIEIKNLTAGYGMVKVLRDINIAVQDGECVGIVGPNGAGKSTLFRAISGVAKTMQGEIVLNGKNITGHSPWNVAKLGIAHVPEGRLLFGTMTVEENIQIAMDSVAYPKAKQAGQYEMVYDLFPILKEKRKQKAGDLSGGQQQMVAVARGMVVSPKILLLDEPSLGLAPIVTQEICAAVEKLKGSNMSIIVADQNASMVMKMASRVYILAEGTVVIDGPSEELRHNDEVWKAYVNND